MRLLMLITASILCLVAPVLARGGDTADSGTPRSYFQARSDQFTLSWTAKNLVAESLSAPHRVIFSARAIFDQGRSAIKGDIPLEYRTFRLRSLLGPILSYDDYVEDNWNAVQHSTATMSCKSVNLDLGAKTISLRDLFPDDDLFQALMKTKYVQRAFEPILSEGEQKVALPPPPGGYDQPGRKYKKPANLTELLKSYGNGRESNLNPNGQIHMYLMDKDLLTRFAFYDAVGDDLIVRLTCAPFPNGQTSSFDLTLPVRHDQKIEKWIEAARNGKDGIFLKQVETKFGKSATVFSSAKTAKQIRTPQPATR